ncbi:MAG: acyl-CoA dehydratase activase [bacterium]
MECGIDLGSRAVKLVLTEDGRVVETRLYDTPLFYRNFCRREGEALSLDLEKLGMKEPQETAVTGYGRGRFPLAGGAALLELKAHVLGAIFQTRLHDFLLLDIGGQDTKLIRVQDGRMADFRTNDRCAASSGKYLEAMASALGMDFAELGNYREDPVELSSTCAIFSESEIIGKIAEGVPLPRLAAGVNHSIIKRIAPMLSAFPSAPLVFVGGTASNEALRAILIRERGMQVIVPPLPFHNGALGCCVGISALRLE